MADTDFTPIQLTKCLADETRLRILNLILWQEELCVCEFTEALELSQPKISRHLGVLRENTLVQDRREGLWVHYRIHPDLPAWARSTLQALSEAEGDTWYVEDRTRFQLMSEQEAICA